MGEEKKKKRAADLTKASLIRSATEVSSPSTICHTSTPEEGE